MTTLDFALRQRDRLLAELTAHATTGGGEPTHPRGGTCDACAQMRADLKYVDGVIVSEERYEHGVELIPFSELA